MTQAIDLAIAEIGTVEWAKGSNPKVVGYYKDAGHPEIKDDAVSWCSAFVGAMLQRSGIKPSGSLLARSYLKWGNPVQRDQIKRGDIGIIPRGEAWQGHVFFIEAVKGPMVQAVGGNQRDSVSRTEFHISDLIGVRRAVAVKPEKAGADIALSPPKTPVIVGINPGAKPSFIARLWALITGAKL